MFDSPTWNRFGFGLVLVVVLGFVLTTGSSNGGGRSRSSLTQHAATRTMVAGESLDAPAPAGAAATRPNILLVVADDQANSTFNRALMPTVFGELVDKGIRFDRQYVATSVCCPSRAEMLTGLFETHTGVDHNALTLTRPTIVDALKRNGYRTAMAGKYLNSHPCGTRRAEYDLWVCQGNDGSSYSSIDPRLNVNGTWTQRQGVAPEILAHYLTDFVASTPADQPFFAMYSPTTPHTPADDPRYASMPITPPRPPSFDEDTTAAGKPAYTRIPPMDPLLTSTVDGDYTRMARSVRGLDDSVRTLLDSLGDRADNTLVVYISDNGYLYGEHRERFKEAAYEESVNTPMVVRFPSAISGALVGSTSHALVQNVDLAPTFAQEAGFAWRVDGTSLMPLLSGAATKLRDAALIQHCAGPSYPCGVPRPSYTGVGINWPTSFSGVVEQRWKYVSYATGEHELYDLANDPFELDNRAGDSAVASEQARLDGELKALTATPSAPDTTILFASTDRSPDALTIRAAGFTYFASVNNASFVCRLDHDSTPGQWASCPVTGFSAGPLGDGNYTFSVAAVDAHGAADPNPDTRSFSVHSAGALFTVTTPTSPTRKRSGTIHFASAAAVTNVECQFSRSGLGSWRPCSSASGYAFSNLADGRWYFRVRGTDSNGVVTSPPSEAWQVIDNTGPSAAFSAAPAKQSRFQTADFAFTFPEGHTGSVFCTLDGATTTCGSGTFHAAALDEGQHSVTISAFDQLGNKGRTTYDWSVDRTPPVVTATAPTGTIGPDPMVKLTANEPATWIFRLDGGPAFDANPGYMILYSLADGPHTLVSRAMDRAGNLGAVVTQRWTQQTPAPASDLGAQSADPPRATISAGPAKTTTDEFATFGLQADQRNATFECAIDGSGFSPCATGITYEDLSVGDHEFRVRARAGGRTGSPTAWKWTVTA